MGISYPYLSILATIAFVAVVISIFSLFLYLVDQVNKTPILGVYAEAFINNFGGVNLTIVIEHKRGKPVEIKSISLFSEHNTITIEDLNNGEFIVFNSCRGSYVHPGGTCRIYLSFPPGVFIENNLYRGLVVFSEGLYPIAFTPMKPLEKHTKTVYPILFKESPYLITCKNLELEATGVQANISENFLDNTLSENWVAVPQGNWVVVDGVLRGVDEDGGGFFNTSLFYYSGLSIDGYNSIISFRVKLDSERIGVHKRWGLAFYLYQYESQQLMVLSVNTSGYLEVARYWVDQNQGRIDSKVLYAIPLGIDVKSSWLTFVTNISCGNLECKILGYLYNGTYNYVVSTISSVIRFPEPHGSKQNIFVGVFVDNVAAIFDDFIAYIGVKPSNTITVVNVPIGYVVELRDNIRGFTDYSESREGNVTLNVPSTYLGDGSLIIIKYPYPYNEITCLEYLVRDFIFGSSILKLSIDLVNVSLHHGGLAANISTTICSQDCVSGVLPLGLINYANESYFITIKLADLVTHNMLAKIYVINSTYVSKPITISNNLFMTNLTSVVVLKPSNILYIYINGSLYNPYRDATLRLLMRACISSEIPWVTEALCFEYPIFVKFRGYTLGNTATK